MKNILLIVNILCFFSCVNTNSQIIKNVDAEKFSKLVETGEGIIIDVRTSQEFNSGHIIDATNIDYYSKDFTDKLNVVRKDVPIYVYCRSGRRSSSAAKEMEKLGFIKVYNLTRGIGSWQAEGYQIKKSIEGKYSTQPKISRIELNEIINNNKTVLINFSTQWCVPCKKMKPVIEEIERENPEVKVVYIDADVNKELVKIYQIIGVPVFIVFNNGEEFFRKTGICKKEEIMNQF